MGRPPLSMDVDTLAHRIDLCQYPRMSMKRKGAACCAPLLRTRLGRDDAEALASAFKAIADPGRLRLLSFIAGQPGAEACVCHLVQPLGLAQPTVSHHLNPAVTLTEASRGGLGWCDVPGYLGAQIAGAVVGVAIAAAKDLASEEVERQ